MNDRRVPSPQFTRLRGLPVGDIRPHVGKPLVPLLSDVMGQAVTAEESSAFTAALEPLVALRQLYGSYRERDKQDQLKSECPRFQGNPGPAVSFEGFL